MSPAAKAALLSGLVFPGLGQVVQRHYVRGVALAGIASASLGVLVAALLRDVRAVLDKALSGGGEVDFGAVLAEANRVSAGHSSAAMTVALVAILCCWVVGIVDAWVSGRKIEAGAPVTDIVSRPRNPG